MTHTGEWMGNKPTHQRLEVRGSTWIRVENGLLVEGWDYWEQQQATDAVRGRRQKNARRTRRAARRGSECPRAAAASRAARSGRGADGRPASPLGRLPDGVRHGPWRAAANPRGNRRRRGSRRGACPRSPRRQERVENGLRLDPIELASMALATSSRHSSSSPSCSPSARGGWGRHRVTPPYAAFRSTNGDDALHPLLRGAQFVRPLRAAPTAGPARSFSFPPSITARRPNARNFSLRTKFL